MPSASSIRRHLVQTLDEKVMPTVGGGALRMMVVAPPYELPQGMDMTHLPIAPLAESANGISRLSQYWPEAGVKNFHTWCLNFVCEGEADMRVGVTQSMANVAPAGSPWARHGCQVLHVRSPALLLFPPGVPFWGMGWERAAPPPDVCQSLAIKLLPSGALCQILFLAERQGDAEHPLLIEDAVLPSIAALLEAELQERAPDSYSVAQHHLLAFLLRLRRRLVADWPVIGNTAWLAQPEFAADDAEDESLQRSHQVIKRADEFIQTHLTESLTLPQIAAHCGISSNHLNRIFDATLGVSVMRYVNQRRVSAAQAMLEQTNLSIKEIAHLLGFSQVSHFCRLFSEIAQLPPGRYRQMKIASHASPDATPRV